MPTFSTTILRAVHRSGRWQINLIGGVQVQIILLILPLEGIGSIREELGELGLAVHANPKAAARVAAPELPLQARRREEREAATAEVGAGTRHLVKRVRRHGL